VGGRADAAGRPRFLRHLRVEIGAQEVFLFDEDGVTSLNGAAVVAVAPWLDGNRTLGEIVSARPAGLPGQEVLALIDDLADAGLVIIETERSCRPDAELAWWEAAGVDAAVLDRGPAPVGLIAAGEGVDLAPFVTALESANLPVLPVLAGSAMDGPGLDVVVCHDYLDPCLAEVDAAHRAAARAWLLVRPAAVRAWIGPVFQATGPGCWVCMSHRLWGHRAAEAVVQAVLGRTGPARRSVAAMPPVTAAVAQLVALEVGKWLAGHRYPGQHGVWVFDSHDLVSERHELRPRPQCAACGDPGMVAAAAFRPVRLRPAPAIGGGPKDRTAMAADVLSRYGHLVSPVSGIVKRIQRDPHAPPFAHAYVSGPNLSRRVAGTHALRNSMRAQNGGKGFSALEAEVGALCEAAERHSGTWQGDEAQVHGSMSSLGQHALDPRASLLFDERQFADRARWNRAHSPFNHVPAPFDPDLELDWTPVWSLSAEGYRLLPTAMLYFGAPPVPSLFADSNGCAAGSSREDAILQGLLELVERDAVAQWWYNRLDVPAVDLAAFGDPAVADLVAQHTALGRRLWVLDVTSDVGVPAMAAVSSRADPEDQRIVLGFGAHLDAAAAVRRALAEVNQMLGWDRTDLSACDDPDLSAWARTATVTNQPYLRPSLVQAPRVPPDFRYAGTSDIAQHVAALVAVLRDLDLETYVLDQTRPDVGIPVVRVVVPGLRSFWSRYAPGRLFDGPVRDGRLSRPTAYAELNPMPLFL